MLWGNGRMGLRGTWDSWVPSVPWALSLSVPPTANCQRQTANRELPTANGEPRTYLANLYFRFPLFTLATNKLIPANQQRQTTGKTGT
jgi:hypothetical protein